MRIIKKNNIIIIAIILAFYSLPVKGSAGNKSIQGSSPSPLIKNGKLIYIYNSTSKGLYLAIQKNDQNKPETLEILNNPYAASPKIKYDRYQNIWALWEEGKFENNEILIAPLDENTAGPPERISTETGIFLNPDFDFDHSNTIWVAWILYYDNKSDVLVKNLSWQKTWHISSPHLKSPNSPKIIIDGKDRVWVFWVARDRNRDAIYYSVFEGTEWTIPYRLNTNDHIPHVLPDVSLDFKGNPWVVWSSFDGTDYEIFYAFWDGNQWSEEEKITNNRCTDAFPVLTFIYGEIPVVAWSKSSAKGYEISCTYKSGKEWTQEISLFKSGAKEILLPRITARESKIGIVWESGGRIESSLFDITELLSRQLNPSENEPSALINLSLNDNEYIGFGDSITYGYIDYNEAPEAGYIPRLETLLIENYGPSKVINEGWPGETTINGLGRMSSVIASYSARYLLLMEGTNDVIFKKISMDTTAFNLEQMAKICREQGVFPLIATIIPRNDWRWARLYYRERIFELNDKIQQLAANLKIPLTDQFNIYYNYPSVDGGWKSLLSTDHVHPSIKGYKVMTKAWFDSIKRLPFPPDSFSVKRVQDRILFYQQEGNSVSWVNSSKLFKLDSFLNYNIYRKDVSNNEQDFTLIKSIPLISPPIRKTGVVGFSSPYNSGYSYFDLAIDSSHKYVYSVSLLRKDGMEGPGSKPAGDNSSGGN